MKVFFTLPFFLIYLLVLQAFCWRLGRRRMASIMLTLTILFIYAMATPLMTRLLLKAVGEHPPIAAPETLKPAGVQAIVVLGSARYLSPETGSVDVAGGHSLSRVRYTARLARLTGLPVYVSGFEAPALARTLDEDYRVTTAGMEANSRNTAENAAFTARKLLPEGVRRIALVTDAWHMERARLLFAREGFQVYCAPTAFPWHVKQASLSELLLPDAGAFIENQFGLSELAGQVKDRVWRRSLSPVPAPAPSSATPPGTKNRP